MSVEESERTGDQSLTRTERAYRAIKRRILDNELTPGAFLLEQELADLLAMSRTPVREAIVRLSHEGFVEIRPRHGMRVLPVSAKDMAEIYGALTALEAEVAAEVAERGLGADELAILRASVAEMQAALERDDLSAWADADERFHRTLVGASHNRRLQAVVRQFWEQVHRARMITLRLRPKPVRSTEEHMALVDAIEARDAERAARIHREHRVTAALMLVDLLNTHGLTNL